MKISGIAVFEGIVFGRALVYEPYDPCAEQYDADLLRSADEQLAAYSKAVKMALSELEDISGRLEATDPDKAKIFFAHQSLLTDVAIDEEIRGGISRGEPVSRSVFSAFDMFIRIIEGADNEFTRERAADLKDVRNRLLRCLAGKEEHCLSRLKEPVVVFAHELLPSDTATIDRQNIAAIVTETGGVTSHTAIVARSYGIPTVLGVPEVLAGVEDGAETIVDAVNGVVILRPGESEAAEYGEKRKEYFEAVKKAEVYRNVPAVTLDGAKVEIAMNISAAGSLRPEDIEASDGAGLMRSEFLYMESGGELPDEEKQYRSYRAALEAFNGKPVVLRTLDIGGDKRLPSMELPEEENPFLGKRALRLCFDNEELFRTQIRAALRASGAGGLRIMFPMVGSIDDIRRAKSFVRGVMSDLDAECAPYNKDVMLGIMIEIPSIALLSDKIVKEVDFASIGTNDLCQYMTAADRLNPSVSPYYQEFHPAMFRLIKYVADHFTKAGRPLCVCGELGGDPRAALALIGLGLRALSMNAASMAGVKRVVANISIAEAEEIAGAVCGMETAAEVKAALTTKINEITNR